MADHVWLIQDQEHRIRAIGSGGRTDAYSSQGKNLDKRRDKKGRVRLSSATFSTSDDARLAASLVEHALALVSDDHDRDLLVDGDGSGAGFVQGLPTRRKVLHYRDLHHALIVRVGWDALDVDGKLVHGCRHPKVAADQVATSWPLNRVVDDGLDVRRLVAVTDSEVDPPRVVGIWKVKDVDSWVDHGGGNWTIGLKKRKHGDRGGHVGRRFDWDAYRPSSFGYSHDLRVEAGMVDTNDD